jgi:hypothetical protein
MAAEMSPVCAPLALAWQSWPPSIICVPPSLRASNASCVAGGQINRSQPRPEADSNGSTIAAACPDSPFIFQLPAIS